MAIQTTNIDATSGDAIDLTSTDDGLLTIASGVIVQSEKRYGISADDTSSKSIFNNGNIIASSIGVALAYDGDLFFNESDGFVSGYYGVSIQEGGTFVNYGDVSGTYAGASGGLNNTVILNHGTIEGPFDSVILFSGDDTITNFGSLDGTVSVISGGDILTNSGVIDGAVTFTGSGKTDTTINTGSITGNVTIASAHSLLSNSGSITGNVKLSATETLHNYASIHGNVTASTGDYLVNYGVIHGDETLAASDTDAITGDVTGTIYASTSDLLAFKGNFGNETVSSFIGGTGSTHDTIEFWGTTFSSFSQVQAASTTVGSDTIIRLDANDAVTLVGIAPSNLVSADFKFI